MTRRRRGACALLLLALCMTGCRSDGGFGRKDSAASRAFALESILTRESESLDNLADTYRLYFEGTEKRR